LQRPWEDPEVYLNVSGDDVVLWATPDKARAIRDSALQLTTRKRDRLLRDGSPNMAGLGQCVKTVEIGEWYNFEFCSLWTFSESGTIGDLTLVPDYSKLFTTKQYYSKKNAWLLADPVPYIAAKLMQVRLSKASILIEGMLEA